MNATDSQSAAGPSISYDRETLRIEYGPLFGSDDEGLIRRFAGRVLIFPEVRSVAIDPRRNSSVLGYRVAESRLNDFLSRLAAAIGGSGKEMDDADLPQWPARESVTLHRFGDLVSQWQIASASAGQLQLRHPVLMHDASLARRAEHAMRGVSGVIEATATTSAGNLWVRFKPELVGIRDLVRIADSQLAWPRKPHAVPDPEPVDFRMANTTVGVATVGELVLPLAEVLGAGLLVFTQFGTMRNAARQLRQGKLGTPVWLTALLACSVASGQVLAYALTDWSFRYWARRWRRDLAAESRVLIEEAAPMPSHARIQAEEKIDMWTPVERLRPGQSLIAQSGDVIAVDGRVLAGAALVHEEALSGARTPLTKKAGDEVLAGSTVILGKLDIEALRVGRDTRSAEIARTLLRSTASLTHHPGLKQQANELVDRTVVPTLATAGVGLAVGDLFTVGAILHQDWLSGADLAVPLATLRDIRLTARRGVVVRDPSALKRLGESRFVVLDDRPALRTRGLELDRLESRLAESDSGSLLRCVAGAGLYLGDERAVALAGACQQRRLVVRQPRLLALEADCVTVRHGAHTLALRSWPNLTGEAAPPLTVEMDGAEVASMRFKHRARPQATASVLGLRKQGFQVFLASDRSDREAKETADLLGIELYSGELSMEEKSRFLRGLRDRGVLATYVGDFGACPDLAREAHVSISLGGAGLPPGEPGDIVFLGEHIDPLPELAFLARGYSSRIGGTCRRAMLPNLLCVAGAFGGILNGITAGILANIAVFGVYRQATHSLRSLDDVERRYPRIEKP
ncbi:MAG: cation-transporting ATPase [Methylococcaceae bacterium]|nr:cation-transporting ATPase [Methylococcaceae bacterium]